MNGLLDKVRGKYQEGIKRRVSGSQNICATCSITRSFKCTSEMVAEMHMVLAVLNHSTAASNFLLIL